MFQLAGFQPVPSGATVPLPDHSRGNITGSRRTRQRIAAHHACVTVRKPHTVDLYFERSPDQIFPVATSFV
jgi:hypothetical protein